MNTSSNATPLPPEGQPNPNLSIVPAAKKRRSPSVLNLKQRAQVELASTIHKLCLRADIAPVMQVNKIHGPFLEALADKILEATTRSDGAKDCTAAKAGATASEQQAQTTLLNSLRTIQSAARNEFSSSNPARLQSYLVGEDLDSTLDTTKAAAQSIINAANTDHPGSVDTAFVTRVKAERDTFIAEQARQQNHLGEGQTQRNVRNNLVKSIQADRMKIQRAADTAWPHYKPESAEMRVLFKLPRNRPYSY